MLMLKSQNSSAFEQLQVAQSLGLQKKKNWIHGSVSFSGI